MSGEGVSAIVLAGGRSSRFGRDKLAEPIAGKTLLDHAIDSVRPLASDIIVVVAPDAARTLPRDVRQIRDAQPFEGPLAGLLAGLRAAREVTVLVTAGDMPDLQPAVARTLLAALGTSGGPEIAILEEAGRPRPLPMTLARDAGVEAATRLVNGGERSLRALVDALPADVIPEGSWRPLDPEGRSLRDVDTPDDLRQT